MKFGFSILLLASALGGAVVDALPELRLANMDGLGSAEGEMNVEACPPSFPRPCPINRLCCRTSKCCPKACCRENARFCLNGDCYA